MGIKFCTAFRSFPAARYRGALHEANVDSRNRDESDVFKYLYLR